LVLTVNRILPGFGSDFGFFGARIAARKRALCPRDETRILEGSVCTEWKAAARASADPATAADSAGEILREDFL
jgi:hypothetical protein